MSKSRRFAAAVAAVALPVAWVGCGGGSQDGEAARRAEAGAARQGGDRGAPRRELVVFHAGSLSIPLREVADLFERGRPGVRVLLEAAGSRTSARKISDLGRRCDVMASADAAVIDSLLIPRHADWNIGFAGNEMALVFTPRSRRGGEIGPADWPAILLDERVSFGRSDPDADPCGYRTVLMLRLAERYYGIEDLSARLTAKDTRYIRPKETDLLALLETGALDYIFIYRSVAVQHGLQFVTLPDEINLSNPALADHYRTVGVTVSGRAPGETIEHRGGPIVYGVTIPNNAPDPDLALEFVEFLLEPDGGLAVMERHGQTPLVPLPADTYERIPRRLRRFAAPPES